MKDLIALRGSLRNIDVERLDSLGYSVTWAEDVENIRQLDSTSLRDRFAAAALTGLIINNSTCTERCPIDKRAYELADVMLAERAKSLTSKE